MSLHQVISDVEDERLRQGDRWGVINDDRHTLDDWLLFINKYSRLVENAEPNSADQRERLVQVAALSVAAVESFDRNRGFPRPANEYGLGCS